MERLPETIACRMSARSILEWRRAWLARSGTCAGVPRRVYQQASNSLVPLYTGVPAQLVQPNPHRVLLSVRPIIVSSSTAVCFDVSEQLVGSPALSIAGTDTETGVSGVGSTATSTFTGELDWGAGAGLTGTLEGTIDTQGTGWLIWPDQTFDPGTTPISNAWQIPQRELYLLRDWGSVLGWEWWAMSGAGDMLVHVIDVWDVPVQGRAIGGRCADRKASVAGAGQ